MITWFGIEGPWLVASSLTDGQHGRAARGRARPSAIARDDHGYVVGSASLKREVDERAAGGFRRHAPGRLAEFTIVDIVREAIRAQQKGVARSEDTLRHLEREV